MIWSFRRWRKTRQLLANALSCPSENWATVYRWPYHRSFFPKTLPIRLGRDPMGIVGGGTELVHLEITFAEFPAYSWECWTNEKCDKLVRGDTRVFQLWQHIEIMCAERGLAIPWQGETLESLPE